MIQSKFLKSKLVLGMFFFIATIVLTSMQSNDIKDIDGRWDYEVEAADDTMTGEMTIKKSDDNYTVQIETTQFGSLELENIVLNNNVLNANIDIEGNSIEFEFKFDGDSMSGSVSTPDGDLDIKAKRRKEQ
ncbi:hypothetical protein KCTC32516_02325 [Polaribacter huanghezhanensis]|uniref:hypothetical protein n=1 Tax=Polaribacter huanghezhanensis TaxID=1354726 RepID=UPI00264A003C|nr:hypothetical protein [Polaribacter huanghezhanensis]WKD86945.1 hypothetical protein KCTC32516_02325 [Polaribacter huanghezhanensis]